MRHNLFGKKLKSSLILFVTGVVLVSTLFASAVNTHQAYAAGSLSAKETITIKRYRDILVNCAAGGFGWTGYLGMGSPSVDSSGLKNMDLFRSWSNNGVATSVRTFRESISSVNTLHQSYDQLLGCSNAAGMSGANDGRTIIKEAYSNLGITNPVELLCDKDSEGNYTSSRIVKLDNGRTCQDVVSSARTGKENLYFVTDNNKAKEAFTERLDALITEKKFDGDSSKIPGGSLNTNNGTALEKYYLYKELFNSTCSTDGKDLFGNSASTGYQFRAWNSETNSFELAGHSKTKNDSTKVYYAGYYITCGAIAENLNKDPYFTAYRDEVFKPFKDECNSKYDKAYDTIKSWIEKNDSTLTGNAEADISTFLYKYNRNGADKWKLDNGGNSIKCSGLDDMNNEWERIKKVHGLTNAPTTDTNIGISVGSSDPNDPNGTEATCYSAAGGLGWILCPVLQFAAGTAEWAYKDVIQPSLVLSPSLLSTSGDTNGTYQAWQVFRNVANVLFVILLLFIIFSQVSGIGIDNYGIKKTLPKLIIAALLVNISFYICQGLVDISNIVGSGAYDLLNGIAGNITVNGGGLLQNEFASVTFGIVSIVAVGAIGTIIGGVAFWTAIGSFLFAFVPILLSAVVAILLFFVLLAMRQAVVVVLVALSPLAFVAYALPNTKKLFDRWSEVLRGMLLLYPIAALLMAGGKLASHIIFAAGAGSGGGDWWMILTAMAAEIIPLFLIPSVARSAYRATGALGAAINRYSSMATRGTRNGVRNSRAYQRTQGRIQNVRANQRANGRRIQRFDNAQEAVKNGTATRRQRWIASLGRERAAELKRNAREAAEREGSIDAWAGADTAAVTEGARTKTRIDTGQQLVNTADYANAEFANAVIKEAKEEHDNRVQRQVMWNSNDYEAGKHKANEMARDAEMKDTELYSRGTYTHALKVQQDEARRNKVADTIRWNDASYASGKAAEANLARQGDVARTGLYNNNEYIKSRESAQEAGISNEITKMYADKFSRMSMTEVMGALRNSVSGASTENRKEQFTAAAQSLIQMGQADKVREIISGGGRVVDTRTGQTEYSNVANDFGNLVKNDEEFRNRAAQVLGSSGEFTFQEYAKHLGMNGAGAKSFNDWSNDSSDLGKGASLAASLQEKGIDRLDKDGLSYLSKHAGALAGIDASNVARVAANTTDKAAIDKLVNVIDKLSNTQRLQVVKATSANQFVNMNESVRVALSRDALGNAHDAIWQARVGTAIKNDPQLMGRLNATEQKRYVGP